MPAYWRYSAAQKEREKYKIDKSIKYRKDIGEFLSKIEARLYSMYRVNGTISKEIMGEFNSYIQGIGENRPFEKVTVDWIGNKDTFTINVNIDGQEFVLCSLWDIRSLTKDQQINWSPVFVPVVVLPQ
jgi:hypothetical protein